MAGRHITSKSFKLYFLTSSVQFSRKHLEHFPEFLNCVCEYPETWSKIYCPSASSLKYPEQGPVSGLTPLAEWNLSLNQKRGISELSMTLVTRSRLATYTRPLSVPRQNHPWSVMQISAYAANTTWRWSWVMPVVTVHIIGIISHRRHFGHNKSNAINGKFIIPLLLIDSKNPVTLYDSK